MLQGWKPTTFWILEAYLKEALHFLSYARKLILVTIFLFLKLYTLKLGEMHQEFYKTNFNDDFALHP